MEGLLIIAFVWYIFFEGTMNAVSFRKDRTIFKNWKWFDETGIRKYDINAMGLPIPVENPNWYHKLFNIKYKERFPLSATTLSPIAEGWHFLKFLKLHCFIIPISIEMGFWWYPILWFGYGILFENIYIRLWAK
jgi:hypothetical protein